MNQSGIAAAQSSCHTATAYLLNFLEVSANTLQLKDQTTITQVEEFIPLQGTHVFNAFILISVSCWINFTVVKLTKGMKNNFYLSLLNMLFIISKNASNKSRTL